MSTPARGTRGSRRPGRGRGAPPTRAQPQHRVYQPGKRHMELMPSVSRSSGIDKDGDALRDPKVQEEYRAFIQTKVDDYWQKYPLGGVPGSGDRDPESERHRKETEGNILILFRKLREGLLSAQRKDQFALEVYETSLHLSVLFRSPVQTTSTLSHLFPAFYVSDAHHRAATAASAATPDDGTKPLSPPPSSALTSTLIFLLHHLSEAYPSQLSFYTQLRQLHPVLERLLRAPAPGSPLGSDEARSRTTETTSPSPRSQSQSQTSQHTHDSDLRVCARSAYGWLTALARCLRKRDYSHLDVLTRRAAFSPFVRPGSGDSVEGAGTERPDLAVEAVAVLVGTLLEKAREVTWNVLRTAYREVSLRATPTGAPVGDTTAAWLVRSLVLRPQAGVQSSGLEMGHDLDSTAGGDTYDVADAWLDERRVKGEVRRKEGEGMEGRWILVKT